MGSSSCTACVLQQHIKKGMFPYAELQTLIPQMQAEAGKVLDLPLQFLFLCRDQWRVSSKMYQRQIQALSCDPGSPRLTLVASMSLGLHIRPSDVVSNSESDRLELRKKSG